MRLLSIETSCDETAISIVEVTGASGAPTFRILANIVRSQIDAHREFGGVYPFLAKREHAKNLPPIFIECLKQAKIYSAILTNYRIDPDKEFEIKKLLEREEGLADEVLKIVNEIERPAFDAIAVTSGPGLEPALWVGINFAKALSMLWDIPVMPVNHMEGHALSILMHAGIDTAQEIRLDTFRLPALALLISGGHTELVLMNDWLSYRKLGETRDDAVGEAFDKVARLLGLPYPGGPEISRLALEGKERADIELPRPMINTDDYEFSFSGIKTSVLYLLKKLPPLDDQTKCDIAREFQTAVTEVLVKKTLAAIDECGARTLIIAGGVASNTYIRHACTQALAGYDVDMHFPTQDLATDNSVMIGIVGAMHILSGTPFPEIDTLRADSNLSL